MQTVASMRTKSNRPHRSQWAEEIDLANKVKRQHRDKKIRRIAMELQKYVNRRLGYE